MWYQSPSIGPIGQGPPELHSVAAAQFLVPPGFGPTRAAVLDGSSPLPTGICNGLFLYSHSYTPHFPPPQYYPPPQLISQFPQFHTQMTTMADSGHFVSQIHSPTPHTHNQSYPGHPLYHQLTSNSPESLSQPFVHFVPTKTTITPPIRQSVSLSQHNPPLGFVKLEEALNSHTPSLTEMRLEPNFIVDGSPKEKLKSARVKGKFKVISRIMMKRERRLGFSRRKQFQLSAILNSFLELSIHGDNFASGASLGKSNPSDDVTTEVKQDLGLSTTKSISIHQSKLLHETSEVWHRGQHSESEIALASNPCVEACFQLEEQEDHGWVDDKLVGLPPGYGQLHKLSSVNSEFNACKLFDKRSQLEGLFSERMIADDVVDRLLSKVLTSLFVNFHEWYPYDKIEKLTKNVEAVFEGFKSAIPDHSYNNLFVTFGCLHKDQLHKLSNEESEFNALQLFDKRLQLEGLYSEGRIGDAMFSWLPESVIVPTGDMNSIGASMDFFFEVFPSLPYTYHNWRAILNWFMAVVIQCSSDPYVFIYNILLGGIGGRVSLHFAKIELKLDKAFKEMLIKRYESKMISSTVTSDGLAHKWVHSLCRNGFQFTISFKLALIDLLRFGFIDKNMQVLAFLVNIISSGLVSLHHEHVKDAHKLFHEISKKGIEVNRNRLEELIDCFMTKSITFAGTFVECSSLEAQSHKPLFVVDNWKLNGGLGFEDQVEIVVKVYESYAHCQLLMQVYLQSRVPSLVQYTSRMQPEHKLALKWLFELKLSRKVLTTCMYENIISALQSYTISSNDIVVGFLFLNFCMWLGRSLQNTMHNETTSAAFLCFLVVICDSLSEQPHYYLSNPCKLEGLIDGKRWQGYQVVLDISVLMLCLFHVVTSLLVEIKTTLLDEDDEPRMWIKLCILPNSSINMQLHQYGSVEIILREFMLEELQVLFNSHFGKLAIDNSQLVWPFDVVLKLPFEEKALDVALQTNEQLTRVKAKLSDEDMAKPRTQMHDNEVSVSITVSFVIAVVVLWLMGINTIWYAIVAHVQATILVEEDSKHAGLDFIVSEFIFAKFDVSLLHWKPTLSIFGFVTTASIALYYGYSGHKPRKFGLGLGSKPSWTLLDIYHTSVFRNYLLQTGLAKDIHVLQEFEVLKISLPCPCGYCLGCNFCSYPWNVPEFGA